VSDWVDHLWEPHDPRHSWTATPHDHTDEEEDAAVRELQPDGVEVHRHESPDEETRP
jgi:hypothetical protein